MTSSVASGRLGASWGWQRRSSTSVTARCGRTRPCPPPCSTCRCSPSRPVTPRPFWPSGHCCGTSLGCCRRGRTSRERWGAPVLPSSDLSELQPYGLSLETSTPLWYYVLKEAEVMEDGLQLGPVGGTLVGEVLIGLLELDPDSCLSQPEWRPTLPQRHRHRHRAFHDGRRPRLRRRGSGHAGRVVRGRAWQPTRRGALNRRGASPCGRGGRGRPTRRSGS